MLCCHACHFNHLTNVPIHIPLATEVIFSILGSPNSDTRPEDKCSICNTWSDYRLECVACLSYICISCWRSKDQPLWPWYRRHKNRHSCYGRIRSVLPPIWFLEVPLGSDCECLRDCGTVTHCKRCCACIKTGGTVHRCLTCLKAYGCSQLLCSQCADQEIAQHKDHQIRQISIYSTETVTDASLNTVGQCIDKETEKVWRCMFPKCKMGLGDFNAPAQWLHPCRWPIFWEIGDFLASSLRVEASKRCVKTRLYRLKLQDPPNATDFTCFICEKKIAYDVMHVWCMTCKALICNVCINTGRCGHPHTLCDLRARICPKRPHKNEYCNLCGLRCMTGHNHILTVYLECKVCRQCRWCVECCFTRLKSMEHEWCGKVRSEWRMYGPPGLVNFPNGWIEDRAKPEPRPLDPFVWKYTT